MLDDIDDEGGRNTIMENNWNDKESNGQICPGMASFSRNLSVVEFTFLQFSHCFTGTVVENHKGHTSKKNLDLRGFKCN